MFKVGIIGFPNVGKSLCFSKLTLLNVESQNYPFTTIDYNEGYLSVKDARVDKIAKIYNSKKIIYDRILLRDIAGLVVGASEGKGLGNKFLSNIREVDAIIHIIRGFEDNEIINVRDKIDIQRDIDDIFYELLISDIDLVNRRISKISKISNEYKILLDLKEELNNISSLDEINLNKYKDKTDLIDYFLIKKPILYCINGSKEINKEYLSKDKYLVIDILKTDHNELSSTFSQSLIKLIDRITFITAGENECRGWFVRGGSTLKDCAYSIHTDLGDNFIKADHISYEDMLDGKKIRTRSGSHPLNDGDIIYIYSAAKRKNKK